MGDDESDSHRESGTYQLARLYFVLGQSYDDREQAKTGGRSMENFRQACNFYEEAAKRATKTGQHALSAQARLMVASTIGLMGENARDEEWDLSRTMLDEAEIELRQLSHSFYPRVFYVRGNWAWEGRTDSGHAPNSVDALKETIRFFLQAIKGFKEAGTTLLDVF